MSQKQCKNKSWRTSRANGWRLCWEKNPPVCQSVNKGINRTNNTKAGGQRSGWFPRTGPTALWNSHLTDLPPFHMSAHPKVRSKASPESLCATLHPGLQTWTRQGLIQSWRWTVVPQSNQDCKCKNATVPDHQRRRERSFSKWWWNNNIKKK